MSASSDSSRSQLRQTVYFVLIAIGVGGMLGRICAVNAVDKIGQESYIRQKEKRDLKLQRPFLSGNDRSRWCTVRSLVEHGTYAIDEIVVQPNWDTIDMVKHDDQGQAAPKASEGHLYSSKPPLLATLIAGVYWVIHQLTGMTLGDHPYTLGRCLLATVNVVPLLIYFLLLARMVERYGTTDWGRLFVFAAGVFGTFLTTFAIVLTNHLFGAVSAMVTLYATLRIVVDGKRKLRYFFVAGLFVAFTAANELPALAFLVLLSAGLALKWPRELLLGYMPGVAIVAAGFFGTNFLAHGTVVPPYAFRAEDNSSDNWYVFSYYKNAKDRADDKPTPSYWSVRDGSSLDKRSPIDRGEPNSAIYAFHVLVGHHGIFSLTPIWLLSIVGLAKLCRSGGALKPIAWGIAVVSVVCITFYILRPLDDRNYGGMTSGFRWVFWFAPLWLFGMLPAADLAAERRWARGLSLVFLGVSALSVTYPIWNPWTQPWLVDLLLYLDWIALGNR